MKGFLGALCVFLFWSAACIIYVSSGNSEIELLVSRDAKEKTSTSLVSTIPNNEGDTNNSEIASRALEDSTYAKSSKPKVNPNISRSQSKLIADELMLSFAISDTLDVEKDEPELTLETTPEIPKSPSIDSELFYPRYQGTSLVVDQDLIKYATNLKEVLNNDPSKKLLIVGHTDYVGNKDDNFSIGLKKARQIKWYLSTRIGISRQNILAISRGEEDPIEPNDTAWGRDRNNRVEIIVQ